MSTKVTLTHRTESGHLGTRTTAAGYGFVLVGEGHSAAYLETARAQVSRCLEIAQDYGRAAGELEAGAATALVTVFGRQDTYGQERAQELRDWERDMRDRAERAEKLAGEILAENAADPTWRVISWHRTRQLAEKAVASSHGAKCCRTVRVEAVNGGER